MADDKLHIKLHIYDTDISVNIPREDEGYYRNASKTINETINTYANLYRGKKSDKEVLYMALIDIGLRYEMERDRNDTAPFSSILGKLTSEIEDALK
jgi:cell division protein ZapA